MTKRAIATLIIPLRRSGAFLLSVATVSFLSGMGYGVVQSYPEPPPEPIIQPEPEIPIEPPPPNVTVRIKAVGDIVPGTNYPQNKLHPNKAVLFEAVQPSLQGADLLFGNFESTLTNYPHSPKPIGGLVIAFRTPPDYAPLLKDAGFDIMSVANNHAYDFSRQGFVDTINNLEQVGIKALGEKGQIIYANINELWIAWIGFSYFNYHNSLNNLSAATALVEEASQNAHLVIVSVHGGAEGTGALHVRNQTEYFAGENRGNLVKFAQTMIDHGADLILGHGPHVPRALERYKGKLIAYSLGNFMGYRTLSTQAQLAYSLVLDVELNNQGDLLGGQIIPILLNRQGIPYPDSQGRTIQLMRQLTQSDFPNTPLQIDSTGKILPE